VQAARTLEENIKGLHINARLNRNLRENVGKVRINRTERGRNERQKPILAWRLTKIIWSTVNIAAKPARVEEKENGHETEQ